VTIAREWALLCAASVGVSARGVAQALQCVKSSTVLVWIDVCSLSIVLLLLAWWCLTTSVVAGRARTYGAITLFATTLLSIVDVAYSVAPVAIASFLNCDLALLVEYVSVLRFVTNVIALVTAVLCFGAMQLPTADDAVPLRRRMIAAAGLGFACLVGQTALLAGESWAFWPRPVAIAAGIQQGYVELTRWSTLAGAALSLGAAILLLGLARSVRAWSWAGRCIACGYRVAGQQRCPECGSEAGMGGRDVV
jgi:hypothetical protein